MHEELRRLTKGGGLRVSGGEESKYGRKRRRNEGDGAQWRTEWDGMEWDRVYVL